MKTIIINIEPYMIGKKVVISVENNDNNKTTDRKNFSHDHCHRCENTNSLVIKKIKSKKNSVTVDDYKTPKMDVNTSMQITNLHGEIADLNGMNEKLKKENELLEKKCKELQGDIDFLEKKCEGFRLYIELLDKYYKNVFSDDFWKSVSKFSNFLKMVRNEKCSDANK